MNTSKKIILSKLPVFSGFLVLSFLLTSCQFKKSKYSKAVVVKVNEKSLSANTFGDRLAKKLKYFDALAAKDQSNIERAKKQVINDFIINSITTDWAKKNNISVSDQDLNREVNRIRSQYPDDLAFRRILAQENISLSEWKSKMRYTLLEKKVFNYIIKEVPPLDEKQIKSYYQQNKELFKQTKQIYLRQIVVDKEAIANKVRKLLYKNKDFGKLARKYSIAPEAEKDGIVGWIEEGTIDIFDKAFRLKRGAISKVYKSPYGFHIFKVEKTQKSGYIPFDKAKKQVLRKLNSNREQGIFTAWLEKQVRQSKVYKNENLINSVIVETRGN